MVILGCLYDNHVEVIGQSLLRLVILVECERRTQRSLKVGRPYVDEAHGKHLAGELDPSLVDALGDFSPPHVASPLDRLSLRPICPPSVLNRFVDEQQVLGLTVDINSSQHGQLGLPKPS